MSFLNRRLPLTLALCFFISCGSGPSSRQSGRKEIRLVVTRGSLLYLPVFVAGPAGCFEKQNLTVKIEETEGAPKSLVALLAGSADVAAAGYLQVLDLVTQGRPLRAFLLMQRLPGFAAVVLPRPSRPIRTIEDLKGAKVGVSAVGGESHRLLNYALQRHGLHPEDISAISIGPSVTQVPSLERGIVDAVLAQGTTITYLQRRHPDLRILFDTRTPELTQAALGVEEVPQSVLIALESWLSSNPDTARRLAGASQCALSWIQGHTPEEIRQILPGSCRSPDAPADLDALASSQRMLSRTGTITPELHAAAVQVSGVVIQPGLAHAYTNELLGRP
jgi:NitT/TauT family transport system substrate-binding protein